MDRGNPVKTLALDTATSRVGVALLEGEELRAELRLDSRDSRSAHLLRAIEYLLEEVQWAPGDLDLVAAGIGPGSFTGIRIGLATALGLAQTLSLPFAGISGLDALAFGVRLAEGRLGVAMDAGRAQVYYAEYAVRGRALRRLVQPLVLNPRDLLSVTRPGRLHLAGDGAEACLAGLGGVSRAWPRLVPADLYVSAGVGRLALRRRGAWRRRDYLQAEPLYVRPPDALKSKPGKR